MLISENSLGHCSWLGDALSAFTTFIVTSSFTYFLMSTPQPSATFTTRRSVAQKARSSRETIVRGTVTSSSPLNEKQSH